MEFYTQNNLVRPVRLCDTTRGFAYDSLNRKYGLDTLRVSSVSLDSIENFRELSPIEKYDCCIQCIAMQAPIRICESERISGSATLGNSIHHLVPATYDGKPVFGSISHLTVDFDTVLKRGVFGIRDDVLASLKRHKNTSRERFLRSCLACIDAFSIWHKRYLRALSNEVQWKDNYQNLLQVPFKPARTFYEAVQSIWFTFAFLRLCGNWPGIGRIDQMLGPYLKRDLEQGRLNLSEAREILAHFFIKGCEWINGQFIGSGDAQHYQNIVLGGIDAEGKTVTNEVTYLVLDIIEELGISDFPVSVRVSRTTDERLLARVAEVMRYGGGILAVYNEDLVIEAMCEDGYSLEEARSFANDGCWEIQVPGKTYFIYSPFDALQVLQQRTLGGYESNIVYTTFEDMYTQFKQDLTCRVGEIASALRGYFEAKTDPDAPWVWKPQMPCTVVSLFEQGCVERGLSYLEGGPVYNVHSPHIGGLADVANALYAIKKIVFDEQRYTFGEYMQILQKNWEGEETLRQYVLHRLDFYGNDCDEVDGIAAQILSDFADICRSFEHTHGYHFPGGVSTFGRQLEWASNRLASPHGRRKGEILAANCSPTPDSDREGATAIIRSYCKADLKKLTSGSALDVKLLPGNVSGPDGVQVIAGLIRGFVSLGGFFMQPDVVDTTILREAQQHPENYQNLSVRVSGWNARFVTLNKEWQEMVIAQNEHR